MYVLQSMYTLRMHLCMYGITRVCMLFLMNVCLAHVTCVLYGPCPCAIIGIAMSFAAGAVSYLLVEPFFRKQANISDGRFKVGTAVVWLALLLFATLGADHGGVRFDDFMPGNGSIAAASGGAGGVSFSTHGEADVNATDAADATMVTATRHTDTAVSTMSSTPIASANVTTLPAASGNSIPSTKATTAVATPTPPPPTTTTTLAPTSPSPSGRCMNYKSPAMIDAVYTVPVSNFYMGTLMSSKGWESSKFGT